MHARWIDFDIFTIVSGLAIMTMAVALWKAIEYKAALPGGPIGKTWNALIAFISFFFLGYITLPFFVFLPPEWKDHIVAFLFFSGAVYVLVTLNLVYKIIISLKND